MFGAKIEYVVFFWTILKQFVNKKLHQYHLNLESGGFWAQALHYVNLCFLKEFLSKKLSSQIWYLKEFHDNRGSSESKIKTCWTNLGVSDFDTDVDNMNLCSITSHLQWIKKLDKSLFENEFF